MCLLFFKATVLLSCQLVCDRNEYQKLDKYLHSHRFMSMYSIKLADCIMVLTKLRSMESFYNPVLRGRYCTLIVSIPNASYRQILSIQ